MSDVERIVGQLKETMERSGKSTRQLAIAAGVGYAVAWRIVNGKADGLTLDTLTRLADVLGLHVELRPKKKGR